MDFYLLPDPTRGFVVPPHGRAADLPRPLGTPLPHADPPRSEATAWAVEGVRKRLGRRLAALREYLTDLRFTLAVPRRRTGR